MPNVLWELQGVQRAELAAAKPGEEAHVEKLYLASRASCPRSSTMKPRAI